MSLTGKQRHHLRALGHHLKPIVLVGHEGVSPGLVAACNVALQAHELVKVRLSEGERTARAEQAAALAAATGAELVQSIGRVVLVYKPRPEEPTIVLPKATAEDAVDDAERAAARAAARSATQAGRGAAAGRGADTRKGAPPRAPAAKGRVVAALSDEDLAGDDEV